MELLFLAALLSGVGTGVLSGACQHSWCQGIIDGVAVTIASILVGQFLL